MVKLSLYDIKPRNQPLISIRAGCLQHSPWRVVLLRTLCDHEMLHTPGCQKFTSFSGPLLVLLTWYIRNRDNLLVLTQKERCWEFTSRKVQKYNVTNIYASHGLLIKGRGVTKPSPSLLFADRLVGYFAVSPLHLKLIYGENGCSCGYLASRN